MSLESPARFPLSPVQDNILVASETVPPLDMPEALLKGSGDVARPGDAGKPVARSQLTPLTVGADSAKSAGGGGAGEEDGHALVDSPASLGTAATTPSDRAAVELIGAATNFAGYHRPTPSIAPPADMGVGGPLPLSSAPSSASSVGSGSSTATVDWLAGVAAECGHSSAKRERPADDVSAAGGMSAGGVDEAEDDAHSAIQALLSLQRNPSPPTKRARGDQPLFAGRPAATTSRGGDTEARYFCRFPRCGKGYASTDAVRKHCRQRHLEWLRRLGHGCPALYCRWGDQE